jgi:hypothetical protein
LLVTVENCKQKLKQRKPFNNLQKAGKSVSLYKKKSIKKIKMAYYYQQQPPQQQQVYYQQQPQYDQHGYYQQDPYYQQQQSGYYYQQDPYAQQQQQQGYYAQQEDPNVTYIDVQAEDGDTVVLEQQPDGSFTHKRISAAEKRAAEHSDPTQQKTVSAEEALSFIQNERAQGNNANNFDPDLVQNIASKWNVSPPKERRMRYLVADLDATLKTSEVQIGAKADPRDSNQLITENVSFATMKREEVEEQTAVISVVEEPPRCNERRAQHRVASVLKPTRNSGFDKLRMEGKPVPPTEDSKAQSASDFTTCLDYFRAETARLMASAPKSSKFGGPQQHPVEESLSTSFGVADFDEIEIAEIDQRERNRDEMTKLRDELIDVSNQVLAAHARLKKEGNRAQEATQLVAHRQAPVRSAISPQNQRAKSPTINNNSRSTSIKTPPPTLKRTATNSSSVASTTILKPTTGGNVGKVSASKK